jgi:hypothetical protein
MHWSRPSVEVSLAVVSEYVVRGLPDEFDEFGSIGNKHRLVADVGIGVA